MSSWAPIRQLANRPASAVGAAPIQEVAAAPAVARIARGADRPPAVADHRHGAAARKRASTLPRAAQPCARRDPRPREDPTSIYRHHRCPRARARFPRDTGPGCSRQLEPIAFAVRPPVRSIEKALPSGYFRARSRWLRDRAPYGSLPAGTESPPRSAVSESYASPPAVPGSAGQTETPRDGARRSRAPCRWTSRYCVVTLDPAAARTASGYPSDAA